MANKLGSENELPIIRVLEDPTPPTTPGSGRYYLYVDEGTKTLHGKDDTGADTDYGAAGGGLSDQDAFTYLDATEAAAPSTPASGFVRIYAKSDGRVYSKDDAGVEYGPFDVAGGGVTFPVIATAAGGNRTTDSTTQTISMPASVASGDLLIAIVVCDGNPTFTWPAGWTALSSGASNSSECRVEARYRVADGSEGASIAITTSASEMLAYNVVRITGYQGTPEATAGNTGASTANPAPASLNPSGWGTEATLWLAVAAYDVGQSFAASTDLMVTAGTTNGPNQRADNANGVGLVIHAHTEERASLLPPPFVLNAARPYRAFTIGVRPA
jgi:hypothetical protein